MHPTNRANSTNAVHSYRAVDLQLSPEQIRQQRGYFASQALAQANWRRLLFD
jgi:hypothetical protein